MHYFITSRQDLLTSSIEMAEVNRLKIFDDLGYQAKIVTLLYNYDHCQVEEKLGVKGRVINLFQSFQQLNYQLDSHFDKILAQKILSQSGLEVKDNLAYKNGKKRIQINFYRQRIYNVGYYDQWGFLDRCDYYDQGCLSYSEFFEDRNRLLLRQYYDNEQKPVLSYYYRGSKDNQPVLTLITLNDQGKIWTFDSEDELRAYFLDRLVKRDPQAVFISDRSDYTFNAFKLMQQSVPRYQFFHSAFTVDGQTNGELFAVYQPVAEMLQTGILTGLICSTAKEAQDLRQRFATQNTYAIPVTYLDDQILNKQINFNNRQKGQLIAVARVTEVKRLDQLVQVVIALHQEFPFIDLKIYGYQDSSNDYAAAKKIKQLISTNQADDYIHLEGYLNDLTEIYEKSDLEVLTSSYEGFAMAVLEAQGHACPVVSYDINYGPRDIIADGQSGRLVTSGDVDGLKNVIKELMDNRNLLQFYSQNAQKAVQKYSYQTVKSAWRKFLQQEKD